MDFLLECIGFSPDWNLDTVMGLVRERGQAAPWRGKPSEHLTMPLAGGLELRLDQEPDLPPNLWPFYTSRYRRRVSIQSLRRLEDSPGDAILIGRANPGFLDGDPSAGWGTPFDDEEHDLTCYFTDATRLPRAVQPGTVVAVMLAGFGLQVEYIGPNETSPSRYGFAPDGDLQAPPSDLLNGALAHVPTNQLGEPILPPLDRHAPQNAGTEANDPTAQLDTAITELLQNLAPDLAPKLPEDPTATFRPGAVPSSASSPLAIDVLNNPRGAAIEFLGGPDSPSASMQISARIRTVSHLVNHLTGKPVNRIELDAPGLPIEVFISPWQLEADGLPPPKPGWRIEGVFLMLGRNIGPLPKPRPTGVAFG